MLHPKTHPFLNGHPKGIPDLQKPAASIQLLEVCPVEGSAVQDSPVREGSLHVGGPGEFLVMHEEWDPVSTGKGAERKATCCKLFVSYPCPGIFTRSQPPARVTPTLILLVALYTKLCT